MHLVIVGSERRGRREKCLRGAILSSPSLPPPPTHTQQTANTFVLLLFFSPHQRERERERHHLHTHMNQLSFLVSTITTAPPCSFSPHLLLLVCSALHTHTVPLPGIRREYKICSSGSGGIRVGGEGATLLMMFLLSDRCSSSKKMDVQKSFWVGRG